MIEPIEEMNQAFWRAYLGVAPEDVSEMSESMRNALAAVLAIVEQDRTTEIAQLRNEVAIAERARALAYQQGHDVLAAVRGLAAELRRLAERERELIAKRAGHPVPGSIRQHVLAEAYERAAGLIEQRLGGTS